jgi:hypothetical protein
VRISEWELGNRIRETKNGWELDGKWSFLVLGAGGRESGWVGYQGFLVFWMDGNTGLFQEENAILSLL